MIKNRTFFPDNHKKKNHSNVLMLTSALTSSANENPHYAASNKISQNCMATISVFNYNYREFSCQSSQQNHVAQQFNARNDLMWD